MKVKFWGVRGSIPCPGPETVRYGGNTLCVEVRTDDGGLIILDSGTGIRPLGLHLMKEESFQTGKGQGDILITHGHWDHIQGFPFFVPAYIGKRRPMGARIAGLCNEFRIHGLIKTNQFLNGTVVGSAVPDMPPVTVMHAQMHAPHFPIELPEMPGILIFQEIAPQQQVFTLPSNIIVKTYELNHPNGARGYRIETLDGKMIVAYITDHEHGQMDDNALALADKADVMIIDSMYTPDDYEKGKVGWGHSTWREATRKANAAKAKQLILFHHEPTYTDDSMDKIGLLAKDEFPNTVVAREGMEIVL